MAGTNELRERVRARLAEIGRSPIEAANVGGLERNYILDLVKGTKESISQKHLAKVAKGLDWSVTQLLGENSVNPPRAEMQSAQIPEIDVRAVRASGEGSKHGKGLDRTDANVGGVRARWGFPAPFIRDELHIEPGRALIIAMRGDSMRDALFDGDRAVIDQDDIDVSQGGIFALHDDSGSIIIKQVELVRHTGKARRILCTSRNPAYHPFELPLTDPVRIVGRVASKLTRI